MENPKNTEKNESLGSSIAVSIQGYEGSFHQVAAQQFFGKNVEVIPCATFREVVKIAGNKKESDGTGALLYLHMYRQV